MTYPASVPGADRHRYVLATSVFAYRPSSPRAAAEQRYEADITILENATHGPQLSRTLAIVCFLISTVFVWRSFYRMRIEAQA